MAIYIQALKKGMPIKRWILLGALIGPGAWCLFGLHYRRAFIRNVGAGACIWRP
ncbi:hypothetical protein PAGA_a2654 [Pseudoalteromonas agarivorans DSM 14585]|uniref:Uncharacterized protein n=1 Tax=Pseudoalteromonas agarivorans DSM 14585 TaxID=1312369 RepID=A0ACA8DXF4_9GAMM|nr:hypothetical protein PAGA_a2654 [Pseudoalteromonas agarivorans DSM 14585]